MPCSWHACRPSRRTIASVRAVGRGFSPAILALGVLLSGLGQASDTLDAAVEEQKEIARDAAQSQGRVDEASAATRQLLEEYKRSVRELDSLRRYNDHVARMTERQDASIRSLETQLAAVQVTERDIVPLMSRMVETLERFIALDAPFLAAERRERVAGLQDLADSPDISLGEKYRRVLEAYQIETDYGRTVEAYRGEQPLGGEERTVDFLRVGRVALLYRSLDGADTGFWDKEERSWKLLPETYHASLEKGLRVAQKQSAPELLRIPVPAPEALP